MSRFVFLLVLLALAPATNAQIFADGVYYPTGVGPSAVVAAQFDGQAGLDIATANGTSGTMSVLLSAGDGVYLPPVNYVVGDASVYRFDICAARLDGDEHVDLAVLRAYSISIFAGDGMGGFALVGTLPVVGQEAKDLCAGDLDNDGDVDLLYAQHPLGGGLNVLLNDGAGNFAPSVEVFPTRCWQPVLAHLNEDEFLDVAFHRNLNRECVVMLGDGAGGFLEPVTYPVPTYYNLRGLAAADLDGDEDIDLVVGEQYPLYETWILSNQGDGSFGAAAAGPVHGSQGTVEICAADFDGEDCPEILPICDQSWIQCYTNDCDAVWYWEDFELLLPYCIANDVAAADIDNDGDLDVVLSCATSDDVVVHLNLRQPTAVADHGAPADAGMRLSQNHPNPFNPSTTIRFALAEAGSVDLRILDIRGLEITRLLDSCLLAAGPHSLTWDGLDARGEVLPSGVYFYRLEAGGGRETRKMLLLK